MRGFCVRGAGSRTAGRLISALYNVRRESVMQVRHFQLDRITLDAERCFGKPCIRELRVPVATILASLSSGMSNEEIIKEWPELEDIHQALAYAAWTMEERVVTQEKSSGA